MNCQLVSGGIEVVVSTKGAELRSISKEGTEYLWEGDAEYWSDRAPLLFPFVGRFTEGRVRLDNDTFETLGKSRFFMIADKHGMY